MSLKIKSKPKQQTGWGNVGNLYTIANFIHRYRIYRIAKLWPGLFCYVPALLYTRITYLQDKSVYTRAVKGLKFMYPHKNLDFHKYSMAMITNIASLLFHLYFDIPNLTLNDIGTDKKVQVFGKERVSSSLKKRKGVIMPIIHLANFFQGAPAAFSFPEKPPIVGIANLRHELVYKDIPLIGRNKELKILGTDKFIKIKDTLIKYLKKNAIALIMIDFTSKTQLRVPFYKKPYDFLVPVPLSAAALNQSTGADIIPAVPVPNGTYDGYSRTKIIVCKPVSLEYPLNFDENDKNLKRKLYGDLMWRINLETNKYILKYPHFWEEVQSLSGDKQKETIHFKEDLNSPEILILIRNTIQIFLNNVYEPGFSFTNKETEILMKFDVKIKELNGKTSSKLPTKNKKITIQIRTATKYINDIIKPIIVLFKKYNEIDCVIFLESIQSLLS